MDKNRTLAPVALFVYNRLSNTRQVVEALQKNRLAGETDVYVFSDAPKSEKDAGAVEGVRRYLRTIGGFRSFTVIERPENYYIEKNITEGVAEIVNRHGKIIVLEDDGVASPDFLAFMNDALDLYEDRKRIMHIAAFTFIDMPAGYHKTIIWRYSENTGGGWATWKDRWEKFRWFKSEGEVLPLLSQELKNYIELEGAFKCLGALKLNPIPWDICWYIAIARNGGLAVNSPRSLIKNNGLFNGTHFTFLNRMLGRSPFEVELSAEQEIVFEDKIEENEEAIALLRDFYAKLGKRKRDKALGFLLKILVAMKITKAVKRLLK